MKKFLFGLLLYAGVSSAQIGNFPALVGQRGTTVPTNCAIGQLFFDTDATAGSNIYGCTAANTWTLMGSGAGTVVADLVTTTCTVAAGVLYNASTPCSANLTFSATGSIGSGPLVTIGSGNSTVSGWHIGNYGTGISGLWSTGVTPSTTNFTLAFATNGTAYLNAATSSTSINIAKGATNIATFGGVDSSAGVAGAGLYIYPGTATTDVAALSVTRTNNNAAVATGVKFAFTDTTSAAGFLPFQVLGGAGGATNLFSVDKTGGFVAPGAAVVLSGLGASTGTPSSLCMNGTTVTVNAALTCTVSSAVYKSGIEGFGGDALKVVNAMEPSSFFYKDRLDRPRLGFIAESLAKIDPRLAEWDHGRPNSIDFPAIMAVQTKAIQELDARLRKVEAK